MSVINTNVKALAAQASMSNVNKSMETAMERLSTGIRINSAKDDAAGLAIALRMTADIRGTAVAIRNANDAISLSQTAEGGLGQINDILQRMRELAVQSSNGTAAADNRAASQLEITQLKQEIDTIAGRTNFNGIKLLEGNASKMNIQTGVNAGDMMTMSIAASRTTDLGIGGRASLTATGQSGTAGSLAKQLNAGDLIINGVAVGSSSSLDDNLSLGDKSSSAIAKVAAINAVSSLSGVTATVGKTVVSGTAMTGMADTSGTVTINGVTTGTFATTADAGVSRSNTVAAINLISAQTGVRAVDTGDLNKGVQLIAEDGRNITVAFSTHTDAKTGLGAAAVTSGTYQLTSVSGAPISLSSSSSGVISNAGVSAGTFQANVSTVTSVARSVAASATAPSRTTTGLLEAGTMRINGIAIDAAVTASDTASYVGAASSTKAASAIAIAAAINAKTSMTGVTAKADANVIVGDAFTLSATAKSLYINGVTVSLTADQSSTRAGIVTEINKVTGQTGVVASDNGRGLTLTAADGRNIVLAAQTNTGGGQTTGIDLGLNNAALNVNYVKAVAAAPATSDADKTTAANTGFTTYSTISLTSDVAFSIEGGSDGNASFEKLGFKTGTVGGANNGIKVANVDVSTQTGAQLAITALDAAMKTVSMSQAQLGAYQNRLDSAIANLTEGSTNMNASRSRVLDTDYAKESTNLAKAQIISQAATAMLAQANQSAQSVLALLK
jgi:flagellin